MSYSVLLSTLLSLMRFRVLLSGRKRQDRDILLKLQSLFHGNSPIMTYSLFAAATIISSKLIVDSCPRNKRWAKDCGLPLDLINAVEILILQVLDYKIHISKEAFDQWVRFIFNTDYLTAYRADQHAAADITSRHYYDSMTASRHDQHDEVLANLLLDFSNNRPRRRKEVVH